MFSKFKILSLLLILTLTVAACGRGGEEPDPDPDPDPDPVVTHPLEVEEWGTGDVKWSEQDSGDGYTLVNNEGGVTLGYSEDSGVDMIQVDGLAFKDLNGNGMLDLYEDWREAPEDRAADLASQLPIELIAPLMLVGNHGSIADTLADGTKTYLDNGIRFVINRPGNVTTEEMANFNNTIQAYAEGTDFGIPLNVSTDPRERGASPLPSNLGLAATFNPEYVRELAAMVATEYRLLGLGTLLGPQIDLATEPRWGRIDGTFGEDPALSRDLSRAFVDGLQSTYDENGNDLGWGSFSLAAMIKHWPGEGAADSGREAHSRRGNAQVFPGGQFETQLIPFVDGAFALDGLTGSATSVMSSYSMHYGDEFSDLLGTAYDGYKVQELLRGQYGFDGPITTDWGSHGNSGYGATGEDSLFGITMLTDLLQEERLLLIIMNGVDQIGGFSDYEAILDAYYIGVDMIGEEEMNERFAKAAERLLNTSFLIGLFDNPYIDVDLAVNTVAVTDNLARSFEAQLESVVMLKNNGNVISENTSTDKPTVYVPMSFTPGTSGWFGSPASISLPVDLEILENYFNVITDDIAELGEDEELTADHIIRRTSEELVDIDFALAIIQDPINEGSYFAGYGYDPEAEEFIPISLQYGPYTADGDNVRRVSLSGDVIIVEDAVGYDSGYYIDVDYNRDYYGKTSIIHNYSDLELVQYTAANIPEDAHLIVGIEALHGPMIFSEIEPLADAILIGFGGSTGSGYGIDAEAIVAIAAGKHEPSALLPVQMPKDMDTVEGQYEDVPRDMIPYEDIDGNEYDFAFGLNWSGVISDWRTELYDVTPIVSPSN